MEGFRRAGHIYLTGSSLMQYMALNTLSSIIYSRSHGQDIIILDNILALEQYIRQICHLEKSHNMKMYSVNCHLSTSTYYGPAKIP